jgi:hypothetical protein
MTAANPNPGQPEKSLAEQINDVFQPILDSGLVSQEDIAKVEAALDSLPEAQVAAALALVGKDTSEKKSGTVAIAIAMKVGEKLAQYLPMLF